MNPPADTPTAPRITLPRDHPDVREAERAGLDLNLIEDNLNLTYEQRMLAHDSAMALMLELKHQYEQTHVHAHISS